MEVVGGVMDTLEDKLKMETKLQGNKKTVNRDSSGVVAYINTGVVTNTKACNEQTQKSGPAQEPGPAQKVQRTPATAISDVFGIFENILRLLCRMFKCILFVFKDCFSA